MSSTGDDSRRTLLHGGEAIANHLFGRTDASAVRKVRHLAPLLPIFQLATGGEYYAFAEALDAHFQKLSSDRAAELARLAEGRARKVAPAAIGRHPEDPPPKKRGRRPRTPK
jgi:hypothetical protein